MSHGTPFYSSRVDEAICLFPLLKLHLMCLEYAAPLGSLSSLDLLQVLQLSHECVGGREGDLLSQDQPQITTKHTVLGFRL